jgi:hypothetical protein
VGGLITLLERGQIAIFRFLAALDCHPVIQSKDPGLKATQIRSLSGG